MYPTTGLKNYFYIHLFLHNFTHRHARAHTHTEEVLLSYLPSRFFLHPCLFPPTPSSCSCLFMVLYLMRSAFMSMGVIGQRWLTSGLPLRSMTPLTPLATINCSEHPVVAWVLMGPTPIHDGML